LIPCTRQQLALPTFARPSASSISATDHFPTFVVCDRPLLDRNSRSRLASELTLRPIPLRRNCGSQPIVSRLNPLTRISALKLRLERFRTSHARVLGNLLFSPIRASEIRTNFVGFLFKSSPSCGVGWKNCEHISECTKSNANLRARNLNDCTLNCANA
jgi:hypothetical protein